MTEPDLMDLRPVSPPQPKPGGGLVVLPRPVPWHYRERREGELRRHWTRRDDLRREARQALITLRLIVALWAREVRSAHTRRGQTWRLVRNTMASVLAAAALVYVGLRSVGWLPW